MGLVKTRTYKAHVTSSKTEASRMGGGADALADISKNLPMLKERTSHAESSLGSTNACTDVKKRD